MELMYRLSCDNIKTDEVDIKVNIFFVSDSPIEGSAYHHRQLRCQPVIEGLTDAEWTFPFNINFTAGALLGLWSKVFMSLQRHQLYTGKSEQWVLSHHVHQLFRERIDQLINSDNESTPTQTTFFKEVISYFNKIEEEKKRNVLV